MKRSDFIKIFAGALTFVSALLGYLYNKNWLFIAMFVGLNLFQFGFTKWCILDKILTKLGMKD